jgi:hypothetical protein
MKKSRVCGDLTVILTGVFSSRLTASQVNAAVITDSIFSTALSRKSMLMPYSSGPGRTEIQAYDSIKEKLRQHTCF